MSLITIAWTDTDMDCVKTHSASGRGERERWTGEWRQRNGTIDEEDGKKKSSIGAHLTPDHNHNVTPWWRETKHDGTQSQHHSVVERHQARRDTITTSLSGGETPSTTGHKSLDEFATTLLSKELIYTFVIRLCLRNSSMHTFVHL